MDQAHRALLAEIRRRLEAIRDDPKITNSDRSSNYWGPRVTEAIDKREHDGPALVQYIKSVLRKRGDSAGWNALLEADRLHLSFEDMVVGADEPIRGLFTDEDRRIGAQSLGEQRREIERRREATDAAQDEKDRSIVARVAANRRAEGKPWTPEIEAGMLARMRADRKGTSN